MELRKRLSALRLRPGGENGHSSPLVLAFLCGSLLLTVVLALQAQYAARSHRRVAEGVLRDYEMLAASEFVRRSANEIGYYGCGPVIAALQRVGAGASREELLASDDERLKQGASLVRRALAVDSAKGEVIASVTEPRIPDWLLPRLREAMPGRSGFCGLVGRGAERGAQPARFAMARPSAPSGDRWVGFEVENAALAEWFGASFGRAPLLPQALGHGRLTNDVLSLEIMDEAGRAIFRAGRGRGAGGVALEDSAVEVPFGEAAEGLLRGLSVRVALDPAVAPELVIGGLPRSRLPVLLSLLGLAGGLLVAALFVVRRERAVAALRTEFIARVSHELRTPLTQIRMFAETLLLDRVRSEDERRQSLRIIDREARRLGLLVENVLHLSRSDRQAARLSKRPCDVGALLTGLLESARPLLLRRNARLTTRLDENAVALVDEDAFCQIFLNVLENALKYGPEGQEIRVGLATEPSLLRLTVEDEGPGIPSPERERVFGRFTRLARDEDRAASGTGIGLAVVRELVARHGGRCGFEDAPEGRAGALFFAEFPRVDSERTEGDRR